MVFTLCHPGIYPRTVPGLFLKLVVRLQHQRTGGTPLGPAIYRHKHPSTHNPYTTATPPIHPPGCDGRYQQHTNPPCTTAVQPYSTTAVQQAVQRIAVPSPQHYNSIAARKCYPTTQPTYHVQQYSHTVQQQCSKQYSVQQYHPPASITAVEQYVHVTHPPTQRPTYQSS